MNEPTHVFLSSQFGSPLKEWRQEIYAWAAQNGYLVWNPDSNTEINSLWKDFKAQPLEQKKVISARTEDICLEAVSRAKMLIAILDYGYGRTHELDIADISVTEMEIVQALLSQIPIFIFVSERADPGSRVASLIHILKAAVPAQVLDFREKSGPVKAIKSVIESNYVHGIHRWSRDHTRLITEFCRARHPITADADGDIETGFLEYAWVKHHEDFKIHGQLIDELLTRAHENDNYNTRLLYLWRAVRHLAIHPFTGKESTEWLPRWNSALGEWSKAAAWCGLHGHMLIGRRASVASLLHVRKALAEQSGETKDQQDYLLTHGGLASEYYSISKLVHSRPIRLQVLASAKACVIRALTAFAPGTENVAVSNQLAILGSVQLLAGRRDAAIKTLRRVLSVRETVDAPVGQIAEARAELGFALLRAGDNREAGRLLEESVSDLERVMNAGFAIRAKRKLALYYLQTAKPKSAYKQFLEIEALINLHSAIGQISAIERSLHSLREKLKLPLKKLTASKGSEGYQYNVEGENY